MCFRVGNINCSVVRSFVHIEQPCKMLQTVQVATDEGVDIDLSSPVVHISFLCHEMVHTVFKLVILFRSFRKLMLFVYGGHLGLVTCLRCPHKRGPNVVKIALPLPAKCHLNGQTNTTKHRSFFT